MSQLQRLPSDVGRGWAGKETKACWQKTAWVGGDPHAPYHENCPHGFIQEQGGPDLLTDDALKQLRNKYVVTTPRVQLSLTSILFDSPTSSAPLPPLPGEYGVQEDCWFGTTPTLQNDSGADLWLVGNNVREPLLDQHGFWSRPEVICDCGLHHVLDDDGEWHVMRIGHLWSDIESTAETFSV